MPDRLLEALQQHQTVIDQIRQDGALQQQVMQVIERCVTTLEADGKLLFCGNGGSAADAQHLAAELSGRYYLDRPPLFAEALHSNGAFLTAVSNDYSYEQVFARMVTAAGRAGDVLFVLSTSGNSLNIVAAAKEARRIGMTVIGLTGRTGGAVAPLLDLHLAIPSQDTPRIQEGYMFLGHYICEAVEARMFPQSD